MSERSVHYAGIDYYDRTRPLVDGTVQPAGLSFRFTPLPATSQFMGFQEAPAADAIEMSMSQYLGVVARGDRSSIAIPVFISRAFRLDGIYIRSGAGIREPKDLIGRRVGISNYQRTAALWQRGILQHEFGVRPQDVQWVQLTPTPPPASTNVTLEIAPPGTTFPDLVASGTIDAFFYGPELPPGATGIERLFPNWIDFEQGYYRRTGLMPIMHLVVLKRAVYERDPGLAMALFDAFSQAKQAGWSRVVQVTTPTVMFPWISHHVHQIAELFGDDHWPYGIAKNRKPIDAACQFHHEQGLSGRLLTPADLFAAATLET